MRGLNGSWLLIFVADAIRRTAEKEDISYETGKRCTHRSREAAQRNKEERNVAFGEQSSVDHRGTL